MHSDLYLIFEVKVFLTITKEVRTSQNLTFKTPHQSKVTRLVTLDSLFFENNPMKGNCKY